MGAVLEALGGALKRFGKWLVTTINPFLFRHEPGSDYIETTTGTNIYI